MAGREERARGGKPASPEARRRSGPSSIIHDRSSFINHLGFTLIELLVVISIIVLLMAVLIPTLHRARKQARAVACQANLRQWGVLLSMYVNESGGRLPAPPPEDADSLHKDWLGWFSGGWTWGAGWAPDPYDKGKDIRCCPMATRPVNPAGVWGQGQGGTFLAWGRFWPEGEEPAPVPGWSPYGSYGVNHCVSHHWYYPNGEMRARAWPTADVSGADRIPVYVDHTSPWVNAWKWDDPQGEPEPPESDAIPIGSDSAKYMSPCINRHDGGINAALLDGSVRKVRLKELWTLKWNRKFNTAGRWTRAGGVRPEDWPQWMRGFKEY